MRRAQLLLAALLAACTEVPTTGVLPGGGSTTTASIVVSPANPAAGAPVTFRCAAHPDDGALHAWDFGDGTTATGSQVEHTYAAAGSYRVSLTSTSPAGTGDARTVDVRVGNGAAEAPAGGTVPTVRTF